jgi:hypothetical protein
MDKKKELQALLQETDALIEEGKRYLELNGTKYPLGEWITLKEYARRFHLESTNVVSNWISRGIVPPQNVITIPELNDLKLIKAISYRSAVAKDALDEQDR